MKTPMPIRDILSPFYAFDKIEDRDHILERNPLISGVAFLVGDDARTFVSCGGTGLIAFAHADEMNPSIYLVIDDEDGNAWEAKNMAETGQRWATGKSGPRPSAKLCLRQSA